MTEITSAKSDVKKEKISKDLIEALQPHVQNRTLISARELWMYATGEGRPIKWIRSYKTLLKYVSTQYADIFKPSITGRGSGSRYYIELENVVEFVYLFERGELKSQ